MSKKRKREVNEVDVELVNIYDELADDQEDRRLAAAHSLLSKIFKPGVAIDDDQIKATLTRLFRGLCSSRKSARLGFSVALTELLSHLPVARPGAAQDGRILDILESQTVPEGHTSGQDERDHYFGRLFGAEAIVKSRLLFQARDLVQWKRLLDIICGIALKKPWLRQECGWVLYTCVVSSSTDLLFEDFAIDMVEKLASHQLIRTPEGVAIWLATTKAFPHAKLPKHIWKHGDPLAKKDVGTLADILKDARAQPKQAQDGFGAQGSAMWFASLHFSWDVVLAELYMDGGKSGDGRAGADGKAASKRLSFEVFWNVVVDEGLFSASSSTERKQWGFLLWNRVLETAPRELLKFIFTPNALRCLAGSLKSEQRYLQRSALKVSQLLSQRVEGVAGSDGEGADAVLAKTCLKSLLLSVECADFDQITKSKTIQTLLHVPDDAVQSAMADALWELLVSPGTSDADDVMRRQKRVVTLQGKLFSACCRPHETGFNDQVSLQMLRSWMAQVYFDLLPDSSVAAFPPQTKEAMKERLATCFEQGLKAGVVGRRLLREAVMTIDVLERKGVPPTLQFDRNVEKIVRKGWRRLKKIPATEPRRVQFNGDIGNNSHGREESTAGHDGGSPLPTDRQIHQDASASGPTIRRARSAENERPSFDEGLALLYSLVLFQVYNGDGEAVEILQDILVYHDRLKERRDTESKDGEEEGGDALVEILLSFASRPSKFMRRITVQLFEAFAPQMTAEGLQSLARVLATKENAHGQEEMFRADDVDMEGIGSDDTDSDVEEMDSDVEVVESAAGSSSSSSNNSDVSEDGGADSESESGDGSPAEEADADDAELAAFDAALASALGTRLGPDDLQAEDTSGSSDADMDDDEMLALDEKLTEVFRARRQAINKKKERKEAKETIVNFKNRVLDLIEVYFKHQPLNPLALSLLLPLLTTARTTQTKQLADRACHIVREYASRCKGQNVPTIDPAQGTPQVTVDILKGVHTEACLESSHAHSAACSHASLLLVKTLIKGGVDVRIPIQIYSDTRTRQLTDKSCRVPASFFSDWNNWCAQARPQSAK